MSHCQRTPEGGAGAVPGAGEEVQQGKEAHQGLPTEVSPSLFCGVFFWPYLRSKAQVSNSGSGSKFGTVNFDPRSNTALLKLAHQYHAA